MRDKFEVCISDTVIRNKEDAGRFFRSIWKTMKPATVTLSSLKKSIQDGHPFLCCRSRKEWNGQRLFCVDIDRFYPAGDIVSFNVFIAVLDALGLPPCMAYTTFGNPDRKKERFRLLFLLSEPVTDIDTAWRVSRFLYGLINELVPGSADTNCVRPYNLFFPGKKIVLYRPKMSVRLDIISKTLTSLMEPAVILNTARIWTKLREIFRRDPFIPSVQFQKAPPGYFILLGNSETWLFKSQETIATSMGTVNLRFHNNLGLCYNLVHQNKIIDIYYNIQGALEQSEQKSRTRSMTVFEHYQVPLNQLLSGFAKSRNCDSDQVKTILKEHTDLVFKVMGIRVISNTQATLPVRYSRYAKAVMDLTEYPNLSRLFRRDFRKRQVLASVILVVRDIASRLRYVSKIPEQYIVTHQMIVDKLRQKFRQTITKNALAKWLRQFHKLQLIRLCDDNETAEAIRKSHTSPYKRASVIQIPYFDKSVLIHADYLTAKYKPEPIKSVDDENYTTVLSVMTHQLDTQGWFSRTSFLRCIRQEAALDNTDGFTVGNAATCFDKYIGKIQQELNLIKSSCTKELMVRFPGNHKIGLTKLYYRNEGNK